MEKVPEEKKSIFHKDNASRNYALLASAGIIISGCFATYEKFFSDKTNNKEPQVIIIREDKPKEVNTIYAESNTVKQLPNEQITTIQPSIDNKKSVSTQDLSYEKPLPEKIDQPVIEKKEQQKNEPADEPAFGIVKGSKTSTAAATTTKTTKQRYASGYVIGEVLADPGQVIKIRITEEISEGDLFVMSNTTLKGVLRITEGRITAELKDASGNILYLCDRAQLLGLTKTEKITDGFQVKLTNVNK